MHNQLRTATKLLQQNKNKEAEQLLRQCLTNGVDEHMILSNLAIALKRQGKNRESLEYIQQSLQHQRTRQNLSNACNIMRICMLFGESIDVGEESLRLGDSDCCRANLAMSYLAIGQFTHARVHAERALQLNPNQVSALLTLYRLELKCSGPIVAEKFIDRAIEISPHDVDVMRAQAEHLHNEGAALEAIKILQSLDNHGFLPEHSKLCLARSLCAVGNESEAKTILVELLRKGLLDPVVHVLLQQLVSYQNSETQWLADNLLSDELFRASSASILSLVPLYQAKFTYYDRAQDCPQAAEYLQKKLDLQSRISDPFADLERLKANVQNELRAYTGSLCHFKDQLHQLVDQQLGSEFIFIVGMPRCGSTLLETILAINPDCTDLGESLALTRTLRDAAQRGSISIESMSQLGYQYVSLARHQVENSVPSKVYTDKLLSNFLHIPVIRLILPAAKVIVCKRNPMDHVLSMLKEDFASLNAYASNVQATAEALVCYYNAVEAYGLNQCLDGVIFYDYDQVATQPHQELPKLISQLGWEWNKAFLSPESSRRSIVTASLNQARKPISASSVRGWERYAALLEPARRIFDANGITY